MISALNGIRVIGYDLTMMFVMITVAAGRPRQT